MDPVVSIGVPTFNRAASLRRALDSALGQDYPHLEVVVSDNASTDETAVVCSEYQRRDPRIRYIRQKRNIGATANFQAVLQNSHGEFFMWLADDDWIDSSYVSRCVKFLGTHHDYSLVCGSGRYYDDGEFVFQEPAVNLSQDSPLARLFLYYWNVTFNGMFYGLMRRTEIAAIPLRDTFAGDWLVVAAIVFKGKLRTLEDVSIHRSAKGASLNLEKALESYRLARFLRNEYLLTATNVFRDISVRSPAYADLSIASRYAVGGLVACSILVRLGIPAWRNRIIAAFDTQGTLRRAYRRILRRPLSAHHRYYRDLAEEKEPSQVVRKHPTNPALGERIAEGKKSRRWIT